MSGRGAGIGGGTRWAILGSANIAQANFVPALASAGGGQVTVLGTRDVERGRVFAAKAGLDIELLSYEEAIDSDAVDAVYVALPNALHAEWAKLALRAGKLVLCEKPLGADPAQVEAVLAEADASGALLWEAFVFPFHRQMDRVTELVESGAIGELREIISSFHFQVRSPANIRWSKELAGGALNDVGCYPVHLAVLLFKQVPEVAVGLQSRTSSGVDAETQGLLGFEGGRRLLFSSGMSRFRDTSTRLVGTEGELLLTDPYHPTPTDTLTIHRGAELAVERLVPDEPSFTEMIRHIHAVREGRSAPRHLAVFDSLPSAQALQQVREAARGLARGRR
ncbi:MAG: Gfo/Idh/MocA family protein [Acidimicrobiales bacterium]